MSAPEKMKEEEIYLTWLENKSIGMVTAAVAGSQPGCGGDMEIRGEGDQILLNVNSVKVQLSSNICSV